MGFFDRKVRNGFDEMFDFNRDGELDSFEQGMQFEFLENERQEEEHWGSPDDDESELDDLLDNLETMDEFDDD